MQKSLISLVQQLSGEMNLPQPTAVISSEDQNVKKLLALLRATCDDLLAEHDWQVLQTRYALTTSNGVDNYAFPSDIERFISATFFDETNRWPLRGPLTPSGWEWLKTTQLSSSPFERFRIQGDRLYLYPTPGASPISLAMEYVSRNYVRDGSTSAPKSDFTQDSDICVFDHRVVIYGTKVKWLASISQDTTAALVDYSRALEFSKGSDSPAPRLFLDGCPATPLLSSRNYPDGSWVV
jgi:hypothetical protein